MTAINVKVLEDRIRSSVRDSVESDTWIVGVSQLTVEEATAVVVEKVLSGEAELGDFTFAKSFSRIDGGGQEILDKASDGKIFVVQSFTPY